MALRDLLTHRARPLGLAHDPSLISPRPLPTNSLAMIGYGPILNVCLDSVHPAPRAPLRCCYYEELIITPARDPNPWAMATRLRLISTLDHSIHQGHPF
jgi:hypothetical protein